ncbi:MAG: hypothetical protein J7J03_07790, partial [Methanosarcinales archaeon]|nr:hypothetical protein [Methanosarcinales archaeon]
CGATLAQAEVYVNFVPRPKLPKHSYITKEKYWFAIRKLVAGTTFFSVQENFLLHNKISLTEKSFLQLEISNGGVYNSWQYH